MRLSKSDMAALADRIADKLLSDYIIKKVIGDMIPVPQEHCPRRQDFVWDIEKEIAVFLG